MANIKSAKKRILVNQTKAARNKSIKSAVKTAMKKVDTAVANNDQIVAGIRAGVMDGMMEVLATTSGGGNSQPIVNEISVTCGEETLYQAVVRGKEKYDRRYQTVATIG